MTTLDWYLISKKDLYLSNLWSAYFGDKLENYQKWSKKKMDSGLSVVTEKKTQWRN